MEASEQTFINPIDAFNDSYREVFELFINDFNNRETLSEEFKQELEDIHIISESRSTIGLYDSIKRKNVISYCLDDSLIYTKFAQRYEDGCGLFISLNLVQILLKYNKNIFNELIDLLTEYDLYDITYFTCSYKYNDEDKKFKIQTCEEPNVIVVGIYEFTEEGKQQMISIFGDRFPFDASIHITVLDEFTIRAFTSKTMVF